MQKTVKRLLKEVAKENDLDEQLVETVFLSLYSSLKQDMLSADKEDLSTFKNLRLYKFGSLRYSKIKHEVWKKRKAINEALKQSGTLEEESIKTQIQKKSPSEGE